MALGMILLAFAAVSGITWLTWQAAVPHGQHAGHGDPAGAWLPPTPLPALAPLPDWQPRHVPDVITTADRIRRFYDAIELDIAVAIDRTITSSR